MATFARLAALGTLAAAAAAAAGKRPHGRILSEEPRLELLSNFLDAGEVSALRRLAKDLEWEDLREDGDNPVNGGVDFAELNESAGFDTDHEGWAVGRRFKERALAWAGLKSSHAVPVLARWEAWLPNRSGALHLDARRRPRALFSAVAYLDGAGATVFPCLETDDMDARELARRQKLCSRAERHIRLAQEKLQKLWQEGMDLPGHQQLAFLQDHPELTGLPKVRDDGLRPVDWLWTEEHDAVAEGAPGALRAGPLWGLAEAMCRGDAPGLRVAPSPGAALLLEVAEKGRRGGATVPHWQLWHAGCSPKKGRRMTLQLFMEDEPGNAGRCTAGDACAARGEL